MTPSNSLMDLCASQSESVGRLYTHLNEFADAGSSASVQVARLTPLLQALRASRLLPETALVSSSESLLSHPEFDMDAVDPAALFYGYIRSHNVRRSLAIRPALSAIKGRIVALKIRDDSLGAVPGLPAYRPAMRLAVLGIGWGHGVPRTLGSTVSVLIRGRRARIVPPIQLEHLRTDVPDVPEAALGDEVVLLVIRTLARLSYRLRTGPPRLQIEHGRSN